MTCARQAIDAVTRHLIRGSLLVTPNGDVEIVLPHRLESPNQRLHAHWSVMARTKRAWKARLLTVIADAAGVRSVAARRRPIDALSLPPVRGRRRVHIERLVPSVRNFIRDDDNLLFAAKPLLDPLKAVGFIRDDSRTWIDLRLTQAVSSDRRDWTVIRIEVPPGASMPLPLDAGENRE